jgi:hypothetical protein
LGLQQFAQKPQGGTPVATTLHNLLKNVAIGVNCPPQPVLLSFDGYDDLVEMPFVGKAATGATANALGKLSTELCRPFRDGLE